MWWPVCIRVKKKKKKKKVNSPNAMHFFIFRTYGTKFSVYLILIVMPFLQFLSNIRQNSDSDSLNTCLYVWILIIVFWDQNFWKFLKFLVVHFDANYPPSITDLVSTVIRWNLWYLLFTFVDKSWTLSESWFLSILILDNINYVFIPGSLPSVSSGGSSFPWLTIYW